MELDGAAVDAAAAASLMQDVQAAEYAAPSALDGSRQSVCTGDSSAALQQPAGAGAATTSAAAASTLSADPLLDDLWMHAVLAWRWTARRPAACARSATALLVHPPAYAACVGCGLLLWASMSASCMSPFFIKRRPRFHVKQRPAPGSLAEGRRPQGSPRVAEGR